ncbi:hypothetical protein [Flocculibacter collagenilyticus]|uniref:hypothetical protein n=1 Tax=Flocculibacter collagenilyticus TaxID=2744479 RepID=UPI0018F62F6D|nr:hypothetical protein [Flocculibacter collagenilyticus]
MSATKIRKIEDLTFEYDKTVKHNTTKLRAKSDRATVSKFVADLVLPDDSILTVDISFDSDTCYHNNAMVIMDDFGAELVADAFETRYGLEAANLVREKWYNKESNDDPRKPTFMFVKKPTKPLQRPKIVVACGKEDHQPDRPEY